MIPALLLSGRRYRDACTAVHEPGIRARQFPIYARVAGRSVNWVTQGRALKGLRMRLPARPPDAVQLSPRARVCAPCGSTPSRDSSRMDERMVKRRPMSLDLEPMRPAFSNFQGSPVTNLG